MGLEFTYADIASIATIVIAALAIMVFFRRWLSDTKRDLQREMGEMKGDLQRSMGEVKGDLQREMGEMKSNLQHETSRIWKRVDDMAAAHQTLSDRVSQIIGSTGVAVGESPKSYKKGKSTTPSAKLTGNSPGNSKNPANSRVG